jgi:peptidoglycan hydrolase-like protein with peptidoglycan-binding domain
LLSQGASGVDVRRLQRLLTMIKDLDYTGIDGVFGPATETAVKGFQQSAGLVVDGIVGPATWGALPADPDTPLLQQGSAGPEVKAAQQALHQYAVSYGTADPGAADGIYGPLTTAAVKGYQGSRGVATDGIIGDQTWWVPAGAAGATLASLAGLTTA